MGLFGGRRKASQGPPPSLYRPTSAGAEAADGPLVSQPMELTLQRLALAKLLHRRLGGGAAAVQWWGSSSSSSSVREQLVGRVASELPPPFNGRYEGVWAQDGGEAGSGEAPLAGSQTAAEVLREERRQLGPSAADGGGCGSGQQYRYGVVIDSSGFEVRHAGRRVAVARAYELRGTIEWKLLAT
jgi:hypothetical protein